eukprot:jgi/Mesvir1/29139/Mv18436-RA.1
MVLLRPDPPRIAKIVAHAVDIPRTEPYVIAYGTVTHARCVILQVFTNWEGVVGIGEASPGLRGAETQSSVMDMISSKVGPAVLGKDPMETDAVMQLIDTAAGGFFPCCRAAFDEALWDIKGKILGEPVHALLGLKVAESFALMWPIGDQTVSDDRKDLEEKWAEGFTTFALKMGTRRHHIADEVERVHALRAKFDTELAPGNTNVTPGAAPPQLHVAVDANGAWTWDEARTFCSSLWQVMPRVRVDFIEQPLSVEDSWARMPELVKEFPELRFSADESLVTEEDAIRCLRAGFHVLSLKVAKCGGITPTLAIAHIGATGTTPDGLASDAGTAATCLCNSRIELGVSQAAMLHVAAVLPNLEPCGHCFMSTMRLVEDVCDFGRLIRHARVRVPDEPGLGVTLDVHVLNKYSVREVVVE